MVAGLRKHLGSKLQDIDSCVGSGQAKHIVATFRMPHSHRRAMTDIQTAGVLNVSVMKIFIRLRLHRDLQYLAIESQAHLMSTVNAVIGPPYRTVIEMSLYVDRADVRCRLGRIQTVPDLADCPVINNNLQELFNSEIHQ